MSDAKDPERATQGPALNDGLQQADAAEKIGQAKEYFAKEEFEKQDRELKELFQRQDQQQKELVQREEFLRADAAEKERQAKELFDRQDFERQELSRQQEMRDQQTFQHMEHLRQAYQREQDRQRDLLRQEIQFQREREIQEPARVQETVHKEAGFEKPGFADVQRAEALRNAIERKPLDDVQRQALKDAQNPERDGRAGFKPEWAQAKDAELKRQEIERQDKVEAQQKALADMVKDAQKAGKDPIEIEERRKAWEELHRQQLESLAQEQRERADRLELLYRGPPSGRYR